MMALSAIIVKETEFWKYSIYETEEGRVIVLEKALRSDLIEEGFPRVSKNLLRDNKKGSGGSP